MKNIKSLLSIMLAASLTIGMTGCLKETLPNSSTAIEDEVAGNLDALSSAMQQWLLAFGQTSGTTTDFGHVSVLIHTEMLGQDVLTPPSVNNVFLSAYNATSTTPGSAYSYGPWFLYYKEISLANILIKGINPGTSIEKEKVVLGTAHAYRAISYFYLIQLYGLTYKGNENTPGIPIVTEKTTDAEIRNNPRAKVSDIYAMILSDLKKAEVLIGSFNRPSKASINLRVVQGYLARVYLTMEDFTNAELYASNAKTGFTILTKAQFMGADPTKGYDCGFNNKDNQNSWIWALDYIKTDRAVTTGIYNFTSMMCNNYSAGYAGGGGAKKLIDASLYASIPTADWRKQVWQPLAMPNYGYSFKFKPVDATNLQDADFPMMRVEEMILIQAEAAARKPGGSLAEGQAILNPFLAARTVDGQPAMVSTATTIDQFIDEVWMQRRIELWGEGYSFFDLKRLNKGITRSYRTPVMTNHLEGSRYNTIGTPAWFLLPIPTTECNNNYGIPQSENNPTVDKPADVIP